MARIDAKLFGRLQTKLGGSSGRVYQLIDAKVRELNLPRELAAIALASQHGLGIARYANEDQLTALREAARRETPPTVIVPQATRSAPRKRAGGRIPPA